MELNTQSEDQVVLVKTNAPSELLAKRIAHQAVENGLAACVNLGEPTLSMYMWKDTLESAQEVPITFKTTGARALALMEHIKSIHPYEVPEILVLPVIAGLDDYIEWIKDCTRER
ncbi:MAG TPA: divalent-cation tolerance protein CutA [Paenalcaligenes sp.]|nr:divalent-cation tolerance protein CutA [Paenalcaligenes sp.]